MNTKVKAVILTAVMTALLLVWAPWITKEYAIDKVVEKLGGPEARFVYLGQDMAVKDVPKHVSWFPFGRYVTFPGEAGWFVIFHGIVL